MGQLGAGHAQLVVQQRFPGHDGHAADPGSARSCRGPRRSRRSPPPARAAGPRRVGGPPTCTCTSKPSASSRFFTRSSAGDRYERARHQQRQLRRATSASPRLAALADQHGVLRGADHHRRRRPPGGPARLALDVEAGAGGVDVAPRTCRTTCHLGVRRGDQQRPAAGRRGRRPRPPAPRARNAALSTARPPPASACWASTVSPSSSGGCDRRTATAAWLPVPTVIRPAPGGSALPRRAAGSRWASSSTIGHAADRGQLGRGARARRRARAAAGGAERLSAGGSARPGDRGQRLSGAARRAAADSHHSAQRGHRHAPAPASAARRQGRSSAPPPPRCACAARPTRRTGGPVALGRHPLGRTAGRSCRRRLLGPAPQRPAAPSMRWSCRKSLAQPGIAGPPPGPAPPPRAWSAAPR